MTVAPLRVSEAADSLRKASTPKPWSRSKTSNWIARGGGLPDYIQHISHAIHDKRGVPESQAIQMAIGIVKRWARGGGNVDAGTRAAAAKALSEWEALKAKNKAKSAVRESIEPRLVDLLAVRDDALSRLAVVEQDYGGATGMIVILAVGEIAEGVVDQESSPARQLSNVVRFDLQTVSGLDIPVLRRVQDVRRMDPDALLEAFSAAELRDFKGRWRLGGVRHLVPAQVGPSGERKRGVAGIRTPRRPSSSAEQRYAGGAVRKSARAREAHARKAQIKEKHLPESIGKGSWSASGQKAGENLVKQPQMSQNDLGAAVHAGKASDTEHEHRARNPDGSLGAYSEERQQLHEQIVANLLQGKSTHEGEARAIFTAGGGAAGKSGMANSENTGAVRMPHDVVIANPDVIREMLPEYKMLKAAGREDAASLTHEEASHITKLVTRIALARQHHILVDGTGDSGAGKFEKKIRAAQAAGHKISVHYATVPTEEAIKRADKRGQRMGRYVDHTVLRTAHQMVSDRFPEVAKIPGVHLQVYSTQTRTPELIAEHKGDPDKLVIRNEAAFKAFLDKAKEKVK